MRKMRYKGVMGLLLGMGLIGLIAMESFLSRPESMVKKSAIQFPRDYFWSPVGHEIRVTGNFGELRSNHFHAGLDIDGTTGVPIYAAAEGYVSKISIQSGAYGNMLQIRHPNGYTTLYAHLDRFAPEIQAYVRAQQYKKERFELVLRPPEHLFPVVKGQEIAKMGNTGGSTGPHLHFEIRNTNTQEVYNPLLFGMPVDDRSAPQIRDLKVYVLNDQREIWDSQALPIGFQKDGTRELQGDTVRIGAQNVGFGIKAFDSTSGNHNDNGIYALRLFADDQLAYEWRMDVFSLDQTRYINAHVDYAALKRFGAWFHRCFILPGDALGQVYSPTLTKGLVKLDSNRPVKINVMVADAHGNADSLQFWVLQDPAKIQQYDTIENRLKLAYGKESKLMLGDLNLIMPKGALYETLTFNYFVSNKSEKGQFSPMHHIQDGKTPVHSYFEVQIRPYDLPESLRNKAVIAKCGDGKPDNCGASWRGDHLMSKIREFGQYCVMIDTTAPKITPVVFNKDMRKKSQMAFRISDNMAVNGLADGLYYRGTIDDKWVLFEYDRKRARLTHTFDSGLPPGMHRVRLEIRDDRENQAVFEKTFLR